MGGRQRNAKAIKVRLLDASVGRESRFVPRIMSTPYRSHVLGNHKRVAVVPARNSLAWRAVSESPEKRSLEGSISSQGPTTKRDFDKSTPLAARCSCRRPKASMASRPRSWMASRASSAECSAPSRYEMFAMWTRAVDKCPSNTSARKSETLRLLTAERKLNRCPWCAEYPPVPRYSPEGPGRFAAPRSQRALRSSSFGPFFIGKLRSSKITSGPGSYWKRASCVLGVSPLSSKRNRPPRLITRFGRVLCPSRNRRASSG